MGAVDKSGQKRLSVRTDCTIRTNCEMALRTVYGSYDSSKWFTDGEPTLPIRKVRQWVLLCLGQE
jgi:hypothetical protein